MSEEVGLGMHAANWSDNSTEGKWCREVVKSKDDFSNLIFSDECTVQLEQHAKMCFRKKKQPRQLKQHPKHPPKLQIWGAISYHGASQVVMLGGIMEAKRYTKNHCCRLSTVVSQKTIDFNRIMILNIAASMLKNILRTTRLIGGGLYQSLPI